MPNKGERDVFLEILDGIIENAYDFIRDDVRDDETVHSYAKDLVAAQHVRTTYLDSFQSGCHPGLVTQLDLEA